MKGIVVNILLFSIYFLKKIWFAVNKYRGFGYIVDRPVDSAESRFSYSVYLITSIVLSPKFGLITRKFYQERT